MNMSQKNVCCKKIRLELSDSKRIQQVHFDGCTCEGMVRAVANLVRGQSILTVIGLLAYIKCGSSSTSCPDQFARMLMEIKNGILQPTDKPVHSNN